METKQIHELNRHFFTTMHGLFNQGIEVMTQWNDQVEQLFRAAQKHHEGVARGTSQVVETWLTNLRQGREQFQRLMDDNFQRLENAMSSPAIPEAPATKVKPKV